MKRFFLLTHICIGLCSLLNSQVITFPADKHITTADLVPLIVGLEVKGYYSLTYVGESKDKKLEWNLLIMDINFKITKDVIVKTNLRLGFERRCFNGTQFCFSFVDGSRGIIEYYIVDMDGKLVNTFEVDHIKVKNLNPFFLDKIYPVPNKGFFRDGLNPKEEEYLEMIGMNGNSVWKIYPKEVEINGKSKGKEKLSYYYADENYAILNVDIPKLDEDDLKAQSDHFLEVLDIRNGKKIFTVDKRNAKGYLVLRGVQSDNDRITFFGQLYAYDKSKSGYDENENLGFYSATFDQNGQLIREHFNAWKTDVAKFIQINEFGLVDSNQSVYMHDIVKSSSGKTYAIGEMYQSRYYKTTVVAEYGFITDLILFEFDDEFILTNVYKFEKYKTSYDLGTANWGSKYEIGQLLKQGRDFNYQFVSQSTDKSVFSCIYNNYDKSDKDNKKYIIGAVGINRDQELINPKIELTSNPDEIKLLPAKPGYVAIIEYFKKKEYATLTLYKFDF